MCIAVNGAIERVRATHFFTLDPSESNMRRMRQRRPRVRYAAAVDAEHELPRWVERFYRFKGRFPEPKEKGSPEWWLWRWQGATGLNSMAGWINTGNSAWGALQWAKIMGVKKAALVGIDATQEERLEGGKPNNLSHLPLLFESGLGNPNFKFINCGHMQSKVPQMTIEEGMAWLMER